MYLTLFDSNQDLCKEWERCFRDIPKVRIVHSYLESLQPHVCLVTAGNSFGIMDGGIDLAVRNMFGVQLQDSVQWVIAHRFNGLLPVGKCIIVPTHHRKFPNLIYAPTMVTPQSIPAENVYNCFKSILNSVPDDYDIDIACCGLGSLTGKLPYKVVAETMLSAYVDFKYRKVSN